MAFLDLVRSRPRRRAIGLGLLRTAPFIAAGVLALLLHYSGQKSFEFNWDRETVIFFVFLLLCWTVYFAVSYQLPYTKDDIINDLMAAAGRAYGVGYRVNMMRLVSHEEVFKSYFRITHSFNVQDPSIYRQEIKQDVPGAGEALKENKTVYVTGSRLRSDIDSYPKHLWSTPVRGRSRGRSGQVLAVLNVDTDCADSMSEAQIEDMKTSIEKISRLIEEYFEVPV